MFQLHDRTRYHLCLVGFVTLCVLPTLLVGGWCLNRRLPGYAKTQAEWLSRQLGFHVQLEAVNHLRPGAVLYEGFELTDPETRQQILRCRWLEIARRNESDEQGQDQTVLVVTAAQPEVEAASLPRVWQCVHRMLDGSYGPLEVPLRLSAGELTLRAADRSQTMTDVDGILETLPGATRAEVQFRLAGVDAPKPFRILIDRNRQISPPASSFELYTGDGQLPCDVLAMALGEFRPLGSRSGFRGRLWANETPDGWKGDIAGQLTGVDLGSLVSDHFPYRLSGIADVTIQSARFCGGRIEEGSASVTAGPGVVDRSLLTAAITWLGLMPGTELFSAGERVPYEQLAFSVTLDAHGLRFCGNCKANESGTVLARGDKRLLGEPPQAQPVAALVQTLAPQSAVQVPASRQTDWLLQHLPVVQAAPLLSSEASAPRAWLKLKETPRR